ncbi:MAG: carboxylating nicotinate-nucleotide diphosphorylase [Nitrospinota bacterium]
MMHFIADGLIRSALREDIGTGDITTQSIIPGEAKGVARVIAKENFVLCGVAIFKSVFSAIDQSVQVKTLKTDGDTVQNRDTFLEVQGPMRSLLSGERTALNFIQRLSGISTLTRRYVEELHGTGCTVLDTRKTTPGWRTIEKYAVLKGGAKNHRKGLFDGILIKDNHIQAAGGVKQAISLARKGAGPYLRIEVETQSLSQISEALVCGADIIMLDNMPLQKMQEAVEFISGKTMTEASGNITIENARAVAQTGVDFISVGALTHSARSVDISMKVT